VRAGRPASVYLEIEAPRRLVYSHGGDDETLPPVFQATVTFTDLGGDRTEVEMRSLFPTAADRDKVVKEYSAIEGGKQTLDRLGEYLAALGQQ
jgi:uncharacterized protein YndB with AHSA1/START domain